MVKGLMWLFPAREPRVLDLQAATRHLGGVSHVSITVEEPDGLVAYCDAQVARMSPWGGGAVAVTARRRAWVLSVLP